MSSLLLVHSGSAVENLEREGIDPDRIHLVGNTMIDSLREHVDRAREHRPWAAYGLAAGSYGLVTLHRPLLVDDPHLLEAILPALVRLSDEVPLVFPLHPRTRQRLEAAGLEALVTGTGLRLTAALGYGAFSASRPTRASWSPTRAGSRRRPRRSVSRASPSGSRPSGR